MTNFSSPGSDPFAASPATGAVADDMAAIFGSDSRADAPMPPGQLVVARSRPDRKRGRLIAVAAVGTLAATVTAGVLAGAGATRGSDAAPVAGAPHRASRPPVGPVLVTTSAEPSAPAPAPSPVSIAVAAPIAPTAMRQQEIADAAPARSQPMVREPAAQPTQPVVTVVRAPTPQPAPAPAPAAVAVARPPAPTGESAPPPPPPQTICDRNPDACLAQRVEAADRQVAQAYEQAVAAGVRRRDLLGYRGEWDRARDEASDRPRYALRIYGMIEADLDTLAARADPRSR